MRARRCFSVSLLLSALTLAACSKDNAVDQSNTIDNGCSTPATDLAKLCPAGTALDLTGTSAAGNPVCPNGEGVVKDNKGSTTGVCRVFASCSVRCKSTCECGIKSATANSVECAPCGVCGDGKCEANERPSCDAGDKSCLPCPKDCGGPTCGDKICNGTEDPQTCPQDCAGTCQPNQPVCVGSKVLLCGANGQPASELADCAPLGQVCGNGKCQSANVCGNGVCDGAETPATCPQDCQTGCQPGLTVCKDATTLLTCSADGKTKVESPCPGGKVCNAQSGKCDDAGVCGNGSCESGESVVNCPSDCKPAVCGNKECEVGESPVSCPQDCAPGVCGNHNCEQGEPQSCPQDCPQLVCTPTDRFCVDLKQLKVCNAAGTELIPVDCGASGQICGSGQCVSPGVCGNGACEPPVETIDSCPADCTAACGNGVCDKPFENAAKCSKDCPPDCGDGFCTGIETPQTCELDCPVNCGNGKCDPGETRKNCSKDCGYCGDGACQPEETPAAVPPPDGSKEPCAKDCVKINCTTDADCDDQIDCTKNTCSSGKCIYTPTNDLCPGNSQCLGAASTLVPGSGCCVDLDGDGYLAASCGGNDCFDSVSQPGASKYGGLDPAIVHPGALGELCDGIDRNCNGSNKAKISASNDTTLPLTPDSSESKLSFEVAMEPGPDGKAVAYLFAWRAMTENGEVLQYAVADGDGLLNDGIGVRTLTTDPAQLAGVLYSPERKQFAIAWTICTSQRDFGRMAWIPSSGDSKGELVDALDVGKLHFKCDNPSTGGVGPHPAYFARAQESGGQAKYTLFQAGGGVYTGGCGPVYDDGSGLPALIGEDGSVSFLAEGPGAGCNGGYTIYPKAFVNRRTRFFFFYQGFVSPFGFDQYFPRVYSWKPTGSPTTVEMSEYNWKDFPPIATFDGTAIVAVTKDSSNALRYQRIDPISFGPADKATEENPPGLLIDTLMEPQAVLTDAKDSQVAIVGLDKATEAQQIYITLRKQKDGSQLTPSGTLAKGDDIRSVRALWDGSAFRAFYASKIKGRHQLYTAPLRCE